MSLAHIAAADQPDPDVWHWKLPLNAHRTPILQPVAKYVSSP
jgi:hypothetical protein